MKVLSAQTYVSNLSTKRIKPRPQRKVRWQQIITKDIIAILSLDCWYGFWPLASIRDPVPMCQNKGPPTHKYRNVQDLAGWSIILIRFGVNITKYIYNTFSLYKLVWRRVMNLRCPEKIHKFLCWALFFKIHQRMSHLRILIMLLMLLLCPLLWDIIQHKLSTCVSMQSQSH